MTNHERSYLLVTPVHNEESHLGEVIAHVEGQSLRPALWVVVDDGSTDGTGVILASAELRVAWMNVLRLDHLNHGRDSRYAAVCRAGFDHGVAALAARGSRWEYVGLLDADMLIPPEYFLSLVAAMESEPRIGVASGGLDSWHAGRIQSSRIRPDWPMGAARLWSRGCFEITGGYQLTPSPDSVSNVRAVKRGFLLRRVEDVRATQVRLVGGASGLWAGHVAIGRRAYYLGNHPIVALLRGLNTSRQRPHYLGIAFLWGFVSGMILRRPRTEDEEVRQYYGRERMREVVGDVVRRVLR